MSGAIPLLLLYALMAWIEKTLPLTFDEFEVLWKWL
jgi:hypothetical protein